MGSMDLKAQTREILGKSIDSFRKQGYIPAEFYGHGVPNSHLLVRKEDFKKVFKEAGENTVIYLDIDDKKEPALIYDTQEDYVSGEILHVDFFRVRMDEEIKAKIPVELLGVAPAIKEKGGILNKSLSEIEVEALPANLPKAITVDVSGLAEFGQSIYVKDLQFPPNVKVALDPETVVVSVSEPMKEEEIAPPAISVEDVKVEGEEKKAERDAAKEAEAPNATNESKENK
jgi:large subunit ribosomal protein L25